MEKAKKELIEQLKQRIHTLQGFNTLHTGESGRLGLGLLEKAFPGQVFPRGTIHEFVCNSAEQTAASEGFISGILAALMQNDSPCLWISKGRKLFPPALAYFEVPPERIIFIDLKREKDMLWASEEALQCPGLAAVITELPELDFAQSRRLQLAAEKSKVTGLVIRTAPKYRGNTACTVRWQVKHQASETTGLPGVGFPRWQVDLLKVRSGQPGSYLLEWAANHFKNITTNPQQQSYYPYQQQTG